MSKPLRAALGVVVALSITAGCRATEVSETPPFSFDLL